MTGFPFSERPYGKSLTMYGKPFCFANIEISFSSDSQ